MSSRRGDIYTEEEWKQIKVTAEAAEQNNRIPTKTR